MKKRSIGMIVIIFLCSATLVFAADQTRNGTKQNPQTGPLLPNRSDG